jgi:hypothetical protein
MRIRSVPLTLAGAVASTALLAVPGPGAAGPALAADTTAPPTSVAAAVTVRLDPQRVPPGGRLRVAAECGFPPRRATAESAAFGRLVLDEYEAGFQGASTGVRSGVRPGEYRVTARCADGRVGTATLVVLKPQTRVRPEGGVATGGGGSRG